MDSEENRQASEAARIILEEPSCSDNKMADKIEES